MATLADDAIIRLRDDARLLREAAGKADIEPPILSVCRVEPTFHGSDYPFAP